MPVYREDDTICAEATPHGRGGISVVRLSGREAVEIAAQFFDSSLPTAGRHKHGRIVINDPEPRILDEAVVAFFGNPQSYTGEDVVEITTHGSPVVVADLLAALYSAGARPAEPGEFTLRAFLNSKLDLTQAEAVGDLISASSREAADQAVKQLGGGIGKAAEQVAKIIERLLITAELELDFVDEDVELVSRGEKIALADKALSLAEEMLKGYRFSRRLREGVKVVLTGPPNVGKSSLFNTLLNEERAIVHTSAGTTRDVLNGRRVIEGIEFEFFDTAGIRSDAGEIEDEGIRRALKVAENADIVIDIDSPDIPGEAMVNSGSGILIRNKTDLGGNIPEGRLGVSAASGEGIEELQRMLVALAVGDEKAGASTISRERHYEALTRAMDSLGRGRSTLISGYPDEMVAEDWREALGALDELTGKRRLAGLLDTIFGEFCIGK